MNRYTLTFYHTTNIIIDFASVIATSPVVFKLCLRMKHLQISLICRHNSIMYLWGV